MFYIFIYSSLFWIKTFYRCSIVVCSRLGQIVYGNSMEVFILTLADRVLSVPRPVGGRGPPGWWDVPRRSGGWGRVGCCLQLRPDSCSSFRGQKARTGKSGAVADEKSAPPSLPTSTPGPRWAPYQDPLEMNRSQMMSFVERLSIRGVPATNKWTGQRVTDRRASSVSLLFSWLGPTETSSTWSFLPGSSSSSRNSGRIEFFDTQIRNGIRRSCCIGRDSVVCIDFSRRSFEWPHVIYVIIIIVIIILNMLIAVVRLSVGAVTSFGWGSRRERLRRGRPGLRLSGGYRHSGQSRSGRWARARGTAHHDHTARGDQLPSSNYRPTLRLRTFCDFYENVLREIFFCYNIICQFTASWWKTGRIFLRLNVWCFSVTSAVGTYGEWLVGIRWLFAKSTILCFNRRRSVPE